MKQNENKATYTAPSIEIIEMENEGTVMSASNNMPGYGNGGPVGTPTTSRSGRSSYNAAGSSDLEDMINDILTVEN